MPRIFFLFSFLLLGNQSIAQDSLCFYCIAWNANRSIGNADFMGNPGGERVTDTFKHSGNDPELKWLLNDDTYEYVASNYKKMSMEVRDYLELFPSCANPDIEIYADYTLSDSSLRLNIYAKFTQINSLLSCALGENALNHLQVHFDICDLYARRIKQALLALPRSRRTDGAIESVIVRYKDAARKEQKKFDLELVAKVTRKEKNEFQALNEKWRQTVRKQIFELDGFANNSIEGR